MKKVPDFENERIVLIIIDMQYEDSPKGFWKAYNWDSVVENALRVLQVCRAKGYPIVHVKVARDPEGILHHPFDVRDESGKPIHSIKGTKNAEIIEELRPNPGELVVEKQRFSAFYQTNIELILQGLKAEHLIMMGVFTDSCFLTSTYDAFTRGYTISIIKDACTAGTEAAHKTSMLDMANWIYGCSIFSTDELVKAVKGESYSAWFWDYPNEKPYGLDNIEYVYQLLEEEEESIK